MFCTKITMIMNKFLKILLIGCSPFVLLSCLEDADKTLVLPNVVYATPIKEVIPEALLTDIEKYMPIYEGTTPPNIEGVYLINPTTLVYTSDGQFKQGDSFNDKIIKFSNQNGATNIVAYDSRESSSADSSELVSVNGTNDNFTAYFIAIGTTAGISTKTSTVISGTMTTSGIQDIKYAFIMLDKGADPDKKLMDVNAYRIFKDGDDLAANTTWATASKVKSIQISANQGLTKYSIYQSNKSTAK